MLHLPAVQKCHCERFWEDRRPQIPLCPPLEKGEQNPAFTKGYGGIFPAIPRSAPHQQSSKCSGIAKALRPGNDKSIYLLSSVHIRWRDPFNELAEVT